MQPTERKRPGRPPSGGQAMSGKERSAKLRNERTAAGLRETKIWLHPDEAALAVERFPTDSKQESLAQALRAGISDCYTDCVSWAARSERREGEQRERAEALEAQLQEAEEQARSARDEAEYLRTQNRVLLEEIQELKAAAQVAPVEEFAAAFEDAFDKLDRAGGGRNFVSLVELRRELAGFERAEFDRGLRQLRLARRFDVSAAEGRHGITPEQRAAGIREGGSLLLYVLRSQRYERHEAAENLC